MKFHTAYAKFRKEQGLSQADIRVILQSKYGLTVSKPQLSKYETGKALPTLQVFFALCDILKVRFPLEHFSDYCSPELNAIGLRKLDDYAEDLIASGRYRPQQHTGILRPLFLMPASAGTGQFLDGDEYDMIELDEGISEEADFAIRIAGDSMEPRYHDGSHVWVVKQNTLEDGQIGIFFLDGNAYLKKLHRTYTGIQLISLNPAYDPIDVSENAEFRVFGRVIS